jgi:hypothetical protein
LGAAGAGLGLHHAWSDDALVDDSWGHLDPGFWNGKDRYKVLEIHLFGGMAPFESFYYRDAAGLRTRGFDKEVRELRWDAIHCKSTPRWRPQGLDTRQFSTDSRGRTIHFGPFAKALWVRPDILARTRVAVQRHALLPHEAATPLSMTGHPIGRPNLAPLGAAIQHRRAVEDRQAGRERVLPHSYALLPQNGAFPDLFRLVEAVQTSIGEHPGFAQPLALKIGPGFGDFIKLLDRSNLQAPTLKVDALLDQYRQQYRDRLRWGTAQKVARSRAYTDYHTASSLLSSADTLKELLDVDTNQVGFDPISVGTDPICASETLQGFSTVSNPTRTALKLAAFLLSHKEAEKAASSVFVLDAGLVLTSLPYDVHDENHVGVTGANLWNVLYALQDVIRDESNPRPGDDYRINLDETLIVINTEFGRTPFKSKELVVNNNSMGRDHWPSAYTATIIGGPIAPALPKTGGRVIGSISDLENEQAVADIFLSPTDLRAALLLAAGVDPFERENFALGSISPFLKGSDHKGTRVNLRKTVYGVGA